MIVSSRQRESRKRTTTGRRIKYALAANAVAVLTAMAAIWLLGALQPVQAQEGVTAPYDAEILRPGDFPTVTLDFPCPDPVAVYTIVENGIDVAHVAPITRPVPAPARVAVVFDLYRKGPDGELPLAAIDTLLAASEIFSDVQASGRFGAGSHEIGLFAPGADGVSVTSMLAPKRWVKTAQTLSDDVLGEFDDPPRQLIQANINSTTALLDVLTNLIESEFAEDGAGAQAVVLFSDGSDAVSTATLDGVIDLARSRGVAVNTVFVPTVSRPDPNLARLAEATGGSYEAEFTNVISIATTIANALSWSYRCNVTYRAKQLPPTRIDVQERGGALTRTLAIAALPGALRPSPPAVSLIAPPLGETITATERTTTELVATWRFPDNAWRRAVEVALTIQAQATGFLSTHVEGVYGSEVATYTQVVSTSTLAEDRYRVSAVVTDDFGLTGSDTLWFEVVVPPTPTPAPTPTPDLSESVQRTFLSQRAWLWGNPIPHSLLLSGQWLLIGLAAILGVEVMRRLWKGLAPAEFEEAEHPPLPGAPAAFAVLVCDRRNERGPNARHLVHLFAGGALTLPDDLLELNQRRYRQAEIEQFSRQYHAEISCRDESARIWRPSPRESSLPDAESIRYEPIHIRLAGSVAPFELVVGPKYEYELQNGDLVQLGNLHYRFLRLKSAPSDDGTQVTPATMAAAGSGGAAHE